MRADEVAIFTGFTKANWLDWLDRLFSRMPIQPVLPIRDEDLIEALLSLYRALPDGPSRYFFGEAAAELLSAAPLIPSSAERLSHLVEVVDYAKPLKGKAVIEYLLSTAVPWHLQYGNTPLQYNLLNAASAYGVDERLISYIQQTAAISQPFEYLVLCFRILTISMNGNISFYFLERLIPSLHSAHRESFLKRELKEAIRRLGCRDLFAFYIGRFSEIKAQHGPQMERFSRVFRQSIAKQVRLADVLEIARQSNPSVRVAIIDMLSYLYQYLLPDLGIHIWDIIDWHATSYRYSSRNQAGIYDLCVNGEIYNLSKQSDLNIIHLLQEAKNKADSENLARNDFDIDIDRADEVLGSYLGQAAA